MPVMIGTTTATREEAEKIASECVTSQVAACVHIDEIDSYYMWEGKVEVGKEFRVFVKTVESAFDDVSKIIHRYHSYDLPAVFCVPIVNGSKDYLDWIVDNSRTKGTAEIK